MVRRIGGHTGTWVCRCDGQSTIPLCSGAINVNTNFSLEKKDIQEWLDEKGIH